MQPLCVPRRSSTHLLKACVKGAVFALEELLPTMLIPVMAPDALDVARGEFTEFAVKNSFRFLLGAPSSSRQRHGADAAVVPCQGSGLIVVQLLLNIWRLRVGRVCGQMGGNDTGHGEHSGVSTPETLTSVLSTFFSCKGMATSPSFIFTYILQHLSGERQVGRKCHCL